MARCNEAIPLSPVSNANRCSAQYASSGSSNGVGTISPIISVSSVNGESGDIVLKDLVVGNKVYNGSNEIHIYANDLGLEKAVIYRGRYLTKDSMATALAEAEVGDLFFCAEDKLFYLSVGEGDYKCFVSDRALKDFYTSDVPAKVEMELEGDDFKLVTKLFNKDNELLCESYPIELPYEIKDIIKEGYYDGVLFHRVIKDFMIQTGDGSSKNAKKDDMLGAGDLNYTIPAEFVYPKFFHKKGALAAARTGDQVNPERASSGSQFYIVTGRVCNEDEMRMMEQRLEYGKKQSIFQSLAMQHRDEIIEMQRNGDQAGLEKLQNELITQCIVRFTAVWFVLLTT